MTKHDKKIMISVIEGLTAITVAIVTGIVGYKSGTSVTQENTIKKFEGNIINGETVTITEKLDDNGDYDAFLNIVLDELSDYKEENAFLKEQIKELQIEQENMNQESNESSINISDAKTEDDNNVFEKSKEDSQITLQVINQKKPNAYEVFEGNGNNGFVMFGNTYTNGFTFTMAASYNMWGHEEQYAIYNIENIAKQHSTICFLVGHVDGYASDSVDVNVFLDKTIDENAPDYYYEISPELAPQKIEIDISNKSSMVIEVKNRGGSTNKVGFANPEFY